MSITKRMWEQGRGLQHSKTQKEEAEKARRTAIAAVFKDLKLYHLAFIKKYKDLKKSQIYKRLYANISKAPSQSKFYQDIKRAKGINEYLTHYFFTNIKTCIEGFDLAPEKVSELVAKSRDSNHYLLSLEDSQAFTPCEEEIENAYALKRKQRRFRHHSKIFPDLMTTKSIYEFYRHVHDGNEQFYKDNPDTIFSLELMDYQDYIQSPFWFLIRNIVLFRDSFECKACGAKATCVHHLSYNVDTLYGKDLTQLVSLCESCHNKIEFDEDGNKVFDIDDKLCRYMRMKNND